MLRLPPRPLFFFFNDTATTEIYTLSLHDALPIYVPAEGSRPREDDGADFVGDRAKSVADRKSTRLNSSHGYISYAVFCLKKKKDKLAQRKAHHAPSPPRTCAQASAPTLSTMHHAP